MKPTTKRRIWFWSILGVVGAALIWAAVLAPRRVPADFVAVVRGPMEVTLDHEGKTRVRDRFVVSAPVPGRVLRIELEPGDDVVAGETVLAVFQPSDPIMLDARSRAQAEALVKAGRAALDRSRADRARASAEHEYTMKERERIRRLAEEGVVSTELLDSIESEAKAMAEALQAAEAGIRSALHELEVAQARLVEPGEAAARSGSVIRLRSPVDGVVLKRQQESEAVVQAGEPLMVVADPDDLEVEADYLSSDAVKIRPGMQARIEQWGGREDLEGQVRGVEPYGFMKVSALGVEEQRVNVIVDFTGPGERREGLGDGYRVEVRIIVWAGEDILQVPSGSLFRSGEDWAVFVVDEGRARLRTVEIGWRNGLAVQVLEGLGEGDRVIAHPSEEISDGVRVEPRQ